MKCCQVAVLNSRRVSRELAKEQSLAPEISVTTLGAQTVTNIALTSQPAAIVVGVDGSAPVGIERNQPLGGGPDSRTIGAL